MDPKVQELRLNAQIRTCILEMRKALRSSYEVTSGYRLASPVFQSPRSVILGEVLSAEKPKVLITHFAVMSRDVLKHQPVSSL